MKITAKEYIRPNSGKRVRTFEAHDDLKENYARLIESGATLGFEFIAPDLVYIFIETEDGDYRNIVTKQEELESTLLEFVASFDEEKFLRWKQMMEEL